LAIAIGAAMVGLPAWGQGGGAKPAASGDEAGAVPAKGKEQEPKVQVERRGGKKVFRITTTFVIEGRIQKPNAFYVLQRSQINYDWAQLKQDFVPRILHVVSKNPF
jgi:hypothetical protein